MAECAMRRGEIGMTARLLDILLILLAGVRPLWLRCGFGVRMLCHIGPSVACSEAHSVACSESCLARATTGFDLGVQDDKAVR